MQAVQQRTKVDMETTTAIAMDVATGKLYTEAKEVVMEGINSAAADPYQSHTSNEC